MTTDVEAATPAAYIAQVRGRIQPSHMYYRQPNGWITAEAATFIERAKFSERGWTPLPQYGRFDMAHVWAADNPLATLFQFGGAKELPVEQVVQMGFYYNPPVVPTCGLAVTERHNHMRECYIGARPVVFPQLQGLDIEGPFPCRFCELEGRGPLPTREAQRNHESVAHKLELGSVRTGEALGEKIVEGLQTQQPLGAPVEDLDPLAVFAAAGIKLLPWQVAKLKEAGINVPEVVEGE